MASSSCVVTETTRLAAPGRRLMGELTRGRDITDRLRHLLRHTEFDGSPDSSLRAQTLITQLLDTFSHCLSMLGDGADSDDLSQEAPSVAKLEDSGDNYKSPAAKDRRGSYKRKRSSETEIKDSSELVEDGHAWRKYGQKAIHNAKHPRNYYRCTHKFDQGCPASKQVQKIEDNPPLFRTTYHGRHTCTNVPKSPHHIIIDAANPDSAILWSFDGRLCGPKPHLCVKQEEDVPLDHHLGPFSSRSVLSSDVDYSCSASTPTSIDDMVGFDDFLEFGNLS